MSSTNLDYQIIHYQGDTFTLEFNYLDDDKNPRLNEDNEDSVMAEKVIYKDGREAYYARVGAYGKLYNPIGMFTEGRMKKYLAKFGKREWTLKKVNPKVIHSFTRELPNGHSLVLSLFPMILL
jgi:hypothetical protein